MDALTNSAHLGSTMTDDAPAPLSFSERKRLQIVEAAIAEFCEHGFVGAGMDQISARANVSKRTVYNHFDSKEALFLAILAKMADKLHETLDLRYQPGLAIEAQLRAFGAAEGRLMTSHDFMRTMRMVITELMREPKLACNMSERFDKTGILIDILSAAHDAGDLVIDDPRRAAEEYIGLIKSQSFWPTILSGVPVEADKMNAIIDSSVAMMMSRYGRGGQSTTSVAAE